MKGTDWIFDAAARADRAGVAINRIGLVVVLVWIGGLKAYRYEDEGIVPSVANSPKRAPSTCGRPGIPRAHEPEGELIPANRAWHERTDLFLRPRPGVGDRCPRRDDRPASRCPGRRLGSFLVVGMSLTTSFLATTPECWVPSLGSPEHGFPLLAGPGRLVIKDAIMLARRSSTMADSARAYLRGRDVAGGQRSPGPGPILSPA